MRIHPQVCTRETQQHKVKRESERKTEMEMKNEEKDRTNEKMIKKDMLSPSSG